MEIQEVNFIEWSKRAYQCACNHGFHDKTFSDEHWMMLTIGEVSEMVEAHRKGWFADVKAFKKSDTVNDGEFKDKFNRFIKDTMEDEMADIIIRLADYTGMNGLSVNDVLPKSLAFSQFLSKMLVSQKDDISGLGFGLVRELSNLNRRKETLITTVVCSVFTAAQMRSIDLSWHVEQKMRYNELRPMLNGKRY